MPQGPNPRDAPRPVTTRDVARAVGVDVASVSRALRGVRGVSEDTAQRVRAAAERLGYRPNPFVAAFTAQVRSYRRGFRGATLAVLDCWKGEAPSWTKSLGYVRGINAQAQSLGYGTEILRLEAFGGDLLRLRRALDTRGLVGMVVLPVPQGLDLEGFDFRGLACATLDTSLKSPPNLHRASPDYYQHMSLALERTAAKGYRRIGYCEMASDLARLGTRWMGAFHAFRSLHPDRCVEPCRVPQAHAHAPFLEWLAVQRPDALVTHDGQHRIWAREAGLRIPQDLGIVYLTASPNWADFAHIDQLQAVVGAVAVDAVVDAIHRNSLGLPEAPVCRLVGGNWVDGASLPPRQGS